jgi:protein MpaA
MQRLGKNHGGYHGEQIDIHAVLCDIAVAAEQRGWASASFYATDDFNWLCLHRGLGLSHTPRAPRIYLSTGIHGDEPAGPLAVLEMLRSDSWPESCEIFLCPCLNPIGFAQNLRENGQGIDLNRDYLHLQSSEVRSHVKWLDQQPAFDLCLCLHEDWESHGFYVYELNPDHKPSLAEAIVAGVEKVCPIDRSEIIEGRAASGGIIRPSADPRTRPQWPEAFWLLTHKTRLSYTLEAPSDFPLNTRVNALVHGVHAALARLLLNSTPVT